MDKVDRSQEPLHKEQQTRSLQAERRDNAGEIRNPQTHPLCKSSSDKEQFAVSSFTKTRICCQIRSQQIKN